MLPAPHQAAYAGAQIAIGMPVLNHGIGAEQHVGHRAQRCTRQCAVERLQRVQFQQRRRQWAWLGQPRGVGRGQLVQFASQDAAAPVVRMAGTNGVDISHAILERWRKRQAHAATRQAGRKQQATAVMDQVLATRDMPELEDVGVRRRIKIGIELHHGIVIGEPGRMYIPRIQARVFQQAQTPALRSLGMLATTQPVALIVWVTPQVLPG
ncbi:hypothetical protein D9M72_539830 [compost metagenome]